MAKRCDKGQGLPVSARRLGREPLPASASASDRSHVGLDPGFIDESQPAGIEFVLVPLPARSAPGDVRAILFAGQHGFF
jgi:hypothetical protein